ncbi:substrate-binding domain-containing protein [Sansalvadorimonas sp. 2012CJ34-2]|uniref:Substrate-binding domain-containing protein n=1 Tax=Parendozoicomonas callyspongiae TaxID=2942213 RepID=A0ABT0PCG8_9GAMM|nr:substrate-binding domain-containing protein [Sansalvadorimonas sp. 2012CJ34-2]MCL6269070.1 substrate-binding domain-containing protein [Sansalvadorimonas sp. 2012CJ34-2]
MINRLSGRLILGLGLFLAALPISASEQSKKTSSASRFLFEIHGSNTIGAQLGPKLVKAFLMNKGCSSVETLTDPEMHATIISCENSDGHVAIKIAAKGSGTGFKAMKIGEAHIVASSRKAKPKEASMLAQLGDLYSLKAENVVALDAITILVNQENPVTSLSIDEISRIFKGLYGNWSRVSSIKRPIRLLARDKKSGTRDTFNSLVLGKNGSIYNRHTSFTSNRELSEAVAADPKAIGFSGFSEIGESKAVAISVQEGKSVVPARMSIATEDYPLTRKLYLYMPEGIKNKDARDFIDFISTGQAQKMVDNIGFIPLTVERVQQTKKPLSSRYARAIRSYERLNVNIRFNKRAPTIDNFGKQSIKRLADYMKNNNGSLLLVGFYGLSEGQKARQFSAEKAGRVSKALVKAGVSRNRILIKGMGDTQLLSTGKSATDNMRNIRVEVWFKPWFSEE